MMLSYKALFILFFLHPSFEKPEKVAADMYVLDHDNH